MLEALWSCLWTFVCGLGMGSVSLTLPNGFLQPLGSFPLQNQADSLVRGAGLDFIPSSDLGKSALPWALHFKGLHSVPRLAVPFPVEHGICMAI